MDRDRPDDTQADASLDLVRRAKAGDGEAWSELYLRYRDRLLLYTRCRLGPALRCRLQSEDILQSVFKDVVADFQDFEPRGQSALERYLHVCVLNKIRTKHDHFAARKRTGGVPLTDTLLEAHAPDDATLCYRDGGRFEKLEAAIERLPESMREVILLRAFESRSNAETAQALGKSPEATSKLFNRAVARLGVALAGLEGLRRA